MKELAFLAIILIAVLGFYLPAVYLGTDRKTGKRVYLPVSSWPTHYHLIGGTGKGKTTAIEKMLHQLLVEPRNRACHIIIDRMGSFSYSLLAWFASPWCPPSVRARLRYIEGANENAICPFNPLLHDSPAHGYYRVGRTTDVILRAWASQNIEETPRLARWIFNAFWAAAQLDLTVADCMHLLMPGSPYHSAILRMLPEMLQAEWREIQQGRGDAGRMLEAPRNRLMPFFRSPILRAMFGSSQSRLDVKRFMSEAWVVIINLAPQNRLDTQVSDAFGGMIVNEILAVARSLPMGVRYKTFVWLDEFQRFVGPDMAEAIPEIRQLMGGGGFICSHQSMSQLQRGMTDLREISYQLQTKLIFGVQGVDADELAHELASISFDPLKIKDEMYTLRQLQTGHEVRMLGSWSRAQAESEQWSRTIGSNWSEAEGKTKSKGRQFSNHRQTGFSYRQNEINNPTRNYGEGRADGGSESEADTASNSKGGSASDTNGGGQTLTETEAWREQLVPVLETFREVTRRSFYSFDEQAALWAQAIRNQARGRCILRLVDDPTLYEVDIERHAPGYLAFDLDKLRKRYPPAIEAIEALLQDNFASDLFVTPAVIERETELRLERILHPVIEVRSDSPRLLEHQDELSVAAVPEVAYDPMQ